MTSPNVVNNFFSNLNSSSNGSGSSSGNNTVSSFFSQFPTQKVTAPIKQVQAPDQGFKIGQVISNIGNTVKNAVNPPQSVKPISLPSGIKLNLVQPTKTTQTQPKPSANTNLSLSGIPTVNNFTPGQKQLNPSQLVKIQAPDIPKKQSSSNNIIPSNESLAQSTIQTLNELKIDPLSLKADPRKAIGDYLKGITSSFTAAKDDISKVFSSKTTVSQKVGSGLKGGAETVGTVLSPITSFFSAANDIPVLGSVNKLITLPFNIVGDLGHTIAYPIVNTLPISKQAKTDIVDGVGEVIALAGQMVLGGKIEGLSAGVKGRLVERFGKTDANTIITKAQDIAKQQVNSPKELPSGEHTPQEVIDHVVNNNLTKTEEGQILMKTAVDAQKQELNINIKDANQVVSERNTKRVVNETLTGKREEARLNTDSNLRIVKAANESIPKDATAETKVTVYRAGSEINPGDHVTFNKENANNYASQREGVSVKQIDAPLKDLTFSNGLKNEAVYAPKEFLKSSKIGKSIEAKAVEANLTKGFDKTAGYTPIRIKEQSERATTLVNNNIDQARAIIRGEETLPEGLKGTSLITAMEEHIKQNPSTDLAYELANSPLVTGTSEAAQELRLAAERNPDSATARIAEVKQARENALKEKTGKTATQATNDTIKQIKDSIKKTAPKKLDWATFIKEVQCK